MSKTTETLLIIAALVIFLPIYIYCIAFVLRDLWLWFIVPLGMVSIGMGHAVGLVLTFSAYKGFTTNTTDDTAKSIFVKMATLILTPS